MRQLLEENQNLRNQHKEQLVLYKKLLNYNRKLCHNTNLQLKDYNNAKN
jgi:hypothetical protein